jgi:hypothetical protein
MRKPIVTVILLFSALLATCFVLLPAAAQKASVPKPQNNLALAEPAVRDTLPLMHADSRGRVSKQDFMRFMEAEFDRLDADKTGELHVAALTRNTQARAFVGK